MEERFDSRGVLEDLVRAAGLRYAALTDGRIYVFNLGQEFAHVGSLFGQAFEMSHEAAHLNAAIEAAELSLSWTRDDESALLDRKGQLGSLLVARGRLGSPNDYKAGRELLERVLAEAGDAHLNNETKLTVMWILASALQEDAIAANLDRVIILYSSLASSDTLPRGLSRPEIQGRLGGQLRLRSNRDGHLEDLDQAIVLLRLASESTPPIDTEWARRLNNLAGGYLHRFHETRTKEDFQAAMSAWQQVLKNLHWLDEAYLIACRGLLELYGVADAGDRTEQHWDEWRKLCALVSALKAGTELASDAWWEWAQSFMAQHSRAPGAMNIQRGLEALRLSRQHARSDQFRMARSIEAELHYSLVAGLFAEPASAKVCRELVAQLKEIESAGTDDSERERLIALAEMVLEPSLENDGSESRLEDGATLRLLRALRDLNQTMNARQVEEIIALAASLLESGTSRMGHSYLRAILGGMYHNLFRLKSDSLETLQTSIHYLADSLAAPSSDETEYNRRLMRFSRIEYTKALQDYYEATGDRATLDTLLDQMLLMAEEG